MSTESKIVLVCYGDHLCQEYKNWLIRLFASVTQPELIGRSTVDQGAIMCFRVFGVERFQDAVMIAEAARGKGPPEDIDSAAGMCNPVAGGAQAALPAPANRRIYLNAKADTYDRKSCLQTLVHELLHNAETRIMPTRLPRPRLVRRRGLRQRLFTEEPWALAGQSRPADDRRDGSGGL
jgi:hypothetical protein